MAPRGPLCCKSFCAFCKVRPYLSQPWNCCSIGAIVSLVFAILFIPAGLTLMGFYVDYIHSERIGLRLVAWLGISLFAAGIGLMSLGLLLWGCVWRAYTLREKTRIHLEMKQGTLYVSSAASRFNESKDSPMLPLRNLSSCAAKKGTKRHSYVDVENINEPGDVRLTKLQSPRPSSVQTFTGQQPISSARHSMAEENGFEGTARLDYQARKSPNIASLQRYSPAVRDRDVINPPPNFPPPPASYGDETPRVLMVSKRTTTFNEHSTRSRSVQDV